MEDMKDIMNLEDIEDMANRDDMGIMVDINHIEDTGDMLEGNGDCPVSFLSLKGTTVDKKYSRIY